LRMLLDWS
jgi:hypothetical protein